MSNRPGLTHLSIFRLFPAKLADYAALPSSRRQVVLQSGVCRSKLKIQAEIPAEESEKPNTKGKVKSRNKRKSEKQKKKKNRNSQKRAIPGIISSARSHPPNSKITTPSFPQGKTTPTRHQLSPNSSETTSGPPKLSVHSSLRRSFLGRRFLGRSLLGRSLLA